MGSLSGKVAFITGAARGQGRAHAVKLASEGADIIAVDLCDQIASVPYPMATADDLNATVKLVEELGGRLDIVIANAGIAPMAGEDAWQDVIDVNLTGVYHTVDVGMRPMIKAGNGGAIVLTSSVAGLVGLAAPQAGSIGYAAAKHGMVGLMRVYANLLGSLDIRVNSIHPAGVRTPMIENEFTRKWLEDMANNEGGNSSIQMDTIEPEDIANTVAWLVSDAGRHITGVTLPVDAGYTNRR